MEYKYEFYSNLNDPTVHDTVHDILTDLINGNNKVTETNYANGLVKYNIISNKKLDEMVGKISYYPVTISVNPHLPDPNGILLNGALEIIKVLTSKLLNTNITNVEYYYHLVPDGAHGNHEIIIFNPITDENISVYENPLYLSEYYKTVKNFWGYKLLSDNPLTPYLMTKIFPENYEKYYYEIYPGIYLILANTPDEILDRLDYMTRKYIQDGYFAYELSIYNMSDLMLLSELSLLWATEIVYDETNTIILKTDVNFGIDPELWFSNNISNIKNGYFPSITLSFNYFNNYYSERDIKEKINYIGLLAYKRLADEDEFIRPFTHTLKVNNDLSVTVSLPTYNHVVKFKEYFNSILLDNIYVIPCKDLTDGVIKRWYIQSIDNKSMPIILNNYVVYRSPLIVEIPSRLEADELGVNELETQLREYYSKCHDNIEPVLLEPIDKMDLNQLLDLMEIKERPDQPSFCYSKNTILSLTLPINPLTRRPFTDDVLIKAMLMEWGLRGLFDIGPLKGLYNEVPKKILVKPISGNILFNNINDSNYDGYYTSVISRGNYSIDVGFEDGMIAHMFDIYLNTNDMEIIKELWNKGFFLNYWVSAVQKYNLKLMTSSYVPIINSALLINAGDSKENSIRAMDYLKESLLSN